MPIRPVVSTSALLMVVSIVVPGCALDMNTRIGQPRLSSASAADPDADLDQLDPEIPNVAPSLGNFPASERLDALLKERDPQSLEAKLGLARLDQLAGRLQRAETAFRETVEQNPNSILAVTALGLFYASEERWTDAARYLDRAVTLAPDDDVIRNQYAMTLARSGRIEQALGEFTLAIGEAEAHYNIGYIHWQRGRIKLAEREFRRSLAIRPDLNRAQTILDRLAAATGPVESLHASDPVPNHAGIVRADGSENTHQTANAIWCEP